MGGLVVAALLAVAGVLLLLKRNRDRPAAAPDPWSRAAAPAPAPVKEKLNWLVGLGGDLDGKAFFVGTRTITLGRAPTNFIQLNGPDVSRVHCQVTGGAGSLRVLDLGSTQGLQLRGEPARAGELRDGEELRIGEYRLMYRVRGDYQDQSVAWKNAGSESEESTVSVSRDKLESRLRAHGGDLAATAADLGLSVEALEFLIKQRGIDPALAKHSN